MNPARIARTLASTLVLTLPAPSQAPVSETVPEFARYHFQDREPLRLDPRHVAVHSPRRLVPASLPASLDPLGIDPTSLPGWSLIRLAEPADESSIENLVAELTLCEAWTFVTPVFLDDIDGPIFPTPDLLVRFGESVATADAERVLASASPGAALEREWAGMHGAFRVRTRERNGLRVLAIAEDLVRRENVRFAEPDFVFRGESQRGARSRDPGFAEHTMTDAGIEVLVLDDGIGRPSKDFTGLGGDGAPVHACDELARCRAVPARVFIADVPCDGGWTSRFSWTADALAWGVARGIRITNNSNVYHARSSAIDSVYRETRGRDGALHFAAAGNAYTGSIAYPASLPSVEAVGAVSFDGHYAGWSCSATGGRTSRRPGAASPR